jgi:hypothetical protein
MEKFEEFRKKLDEFNKSIDTVISDAKARKLTTHGLPELCDRFDKAKDELMKMMDERTDNK